MEKIKIIYAKSVAIYLKELVFVLFDKNYFSYIANADEYVENLKNNLEHALRKSKHNTTPTLLLKYGNYYVKINTNKHTWHYAFFDKKDNIIFVEYISNNHSPVASYLNEL
jgi:hypothetical protein